MANVEAGEEPVDKDASMANPANVDAAVENDQVYEVHRILDNGYTATGEAVYKIWWKGYLKNHDPEWYGEEAFTASPDILDAYKRTKKFKKPA